MRFARQAVFDKAQLALREYNKGGGKDMTLTDKIKKFFKKLSKGKI